MNTIVSQDLSNNPLPRKEWDRIKALAPTSRLFHKSADAAMIPNPALAANPHAMPRQIPWRTPRGQGQTYNVGRNAAKRAARGG